MLSPSRCLAGLGDHCQADVHTHRHSFRLCRLPRGGRSSPTACSTGHPRGSPPQGAGASVWETWPFSVPPSLASTTLSLPLSCLVITGVQEHPSGGPTFGGAAERPMRQEG